MTGGAKWMSAAVLAAALLTLVGCQTNRVQEERDALMTQNKELQATLDQRTAALEAAEAEAAGLRGELTRAQEELAAARSAPAAAPVPAGRAARDGFSDIEGVETVRTAAGLAVRVPGDVLFDSGKAELKGSARQTLDRIAAVIKKDYPGRAIRVEGYTDTDPIRKSKWADNLELSLQRAAAVTRYLGKQGVEARRVYAAGFGEHRPRDSKARSRRVEIVVLNAD